MSFPQVLSSHAGFMLRSQLRIWLFLFCQWIACLLEMCQRVFLQCLSNCLCFTCSFNKQKLHSLVTERCYPVSAYLEMACL